MTPFTTPAAGPVTASGRDLTRGYNHNALLDGMRLTATPDQSRGAMLATGPGPISLVES